MKVVILIDTWFPQIGGGPVRCLEVSKGLVRDYGCFIEIVTRDLGDESLSKVSGVKITKLGPRLAWDNTLARLFFLVSSFFYVLPRKVDLIHAYSFLPGITAKLLALIKQKPVVFTVIGSALGYWSKTKQGWWQLKEWLERFITLTINYDCLVTDNIDFQKQIKGKKISLIVNGVDMSAFERVRVKKDKNFKILFVGRFHPQKGLVYLLKAFRAVIDKYPYVKLVIVGYGKDETEVKKTIDKLNLSKNIDFKGKVAGEDLIRQYKSVHLLVLPSLFEGHPLILFDAWAAKIPVIATNVGTIRLFVKDGVNGYLVKSQDVDGLAKAMTRAMKNPKLAEMGIAGFKMIKNKYSWHKTVEKVYKVYHSLL